MLSSEIKEEKYIHIYKKKKKLKIQAETGNMQPTAEFIF